MLGPIDRTPGIPGSDKILLFLLWSTFDPNYWWGRKAKWSAHAFCPFLSPIARHLTFAPNVFFHICKIIKSPPNRLSNGDELWLQSLREHLWFTATGWRAHSLKRGERLFLASNIFLLFDFFSFRFVSLTLSGAGSEVTLELKLPKKWFPTSYIYRHD